MKCQNCSFEMPENSKFCPKCGSKVTAHSPESKKDKDKEVSSSPIEARFAITNKLQQHLEFLGYKVEFVQDEKADALLAKSTNHSNLVVRIVEEVVMISARYSTLIATKANSIELYKISNEINRNTVASRWWVDVKSDPISVEVLIESFCFGYVKDSFGRLIDLLESDIRTYLPKFTELEDK